MLYSYVLAYVSKFFITYRVIVSGFQPIMTVVGTVNTRPSPNSSPDSFTTPDVSFSRDTTSSTSFKDSEKSTTRNVQV